MGTIPGWIGSGSRRCTRWCGKFAFASFVSSPDDIYGDKHILLPITTYCFLILLRYYDCLHLLRIGICSATPRSLQQILLAGPGDEEAPRVGRLPVGFDPELHPRQQQQ